MYSEGHHDQDKHFIKDSSIPEPHSMVQMKVNFQDLCANETGFSILKYITQLLLLTKLV